MALPSSFSSSSSGSSGGSGFGGFGSGGGSTLNSILYPSVPRGEEETVKDDDPLKEREMLIGVVRLLNSDDDEDKRKARRYLEAQHQAFTDEDLQQFGLDRPKKDDRSLFEKAAGLPGVKGAMSVVGTAGGILSRPGQAVMSGLQTHGTSIGGLLGVTANKLSGGAIAGNYDDVSYGDVAATHGRNLEAGFDRVTDISMSKDLNTRSMLGVDKDAGGSGWFGDYVVGGADLAGQLAMDPLSYVGTAGAGTGTKAGLEGLERAAKTVTGKTGTRGMIEHAGLKGAQKELGWSDETLKAIQDEAVRDMTQRGADAGAGGYGRVLSRLGAKGEKTGGPWQRFVDNSTADAAAKMGVAGAKGSMRGLTGPARIAQRHLNLAATRGQKGLKFGNQTFLASATWKAPFAARRLVNSSKIVENPALRRVVHGVENYDQQIENAQKEIDRLSLEPTPNGRTLQSIDTWEKKLAVLSEERAALADEIESLREQGIFDPVIHTEPNPAFDEMLNDPAYHFPRAGEERQFPFRATEGPPADSPVPGEFFVRVTSDLGRNQQFHAPTLEELRDKIIATQREGGLSQRAAEATWSEALAQIPHENALDANLPMMTGANALFENYDPERIAQFENWRGPAVYTSESVPVTEGYMRDTIGRLPGADVEAKPTRYLNEWLGEEPYTPFDLNKSQPVPPRVRAEIEDALDTLARTHSPGDVPPGRGDYSGVPRVPEDDEFTQTANRVRDMMDEGKPFGEIMDVYKDLFWKHTPATPADSALGEFADKRAVQLNKAFEREGFSGFADEGGHNTGSDLKHATRLVFDPKKVKPHAMPPETITTETLSPEATAVGEALVDLEKRRKKVLKGLNAANERADLQTPSALRTRIDEARTVVEQDDAIEARAKDLRARIKAAKAAEADPAAAERTRIDERYAQRVKMAEEGVDPEEIDRVAPLLDAAPVPAAGAEGFNPETWTNKLQTLLLQADVADGDIAGVQLAIQSGDAAAIESEALAALTAAGKSPQEARDLIERATMYREAAGAAPPAADPARVQALRAEAVMLSDQLDSLAQLQARDPAAENAIADQLTAVEDEIAGLVGEGGLAPSSRPPRPRAAKTEDELLNEIGDMISAPSTPEQAARRAAERAVDAPPPHEAYGGFIEQTPEGALTIDGVPAEKLYRVISPEEWAEAQRTGKLQGGQGQYTRASALPDQRWLGQDGVVVEINYDPTDAWSASAEGYAATKSPIDLSKVRSVEGDEQAALFTRNQEYASSQKAARQAALDAPAPDALPALRAELKAVLKNRGDATVRTATRERLADLESRLSAIEGPRQAKLKKNVDKMELLTGKRNTLVELGDTMPARVVTPINSRFIKTSRTMKNLKEAFVTHNPVRTKHGKRAADILMGSEEAAKGFAKHYGEDALQSFQNTTTAVLKEDKVPPRQWAEELRTRVMPALEREGGSEELYEEFIEEGRQASADWLENYDRVRYGITDDLVRQGKIPAEHMHDPNTYVMRLLEPAAKEAFDEYMKAQGVAGAITGKPNQLAGELTQGGSFDERTFKKELAGDELNKEAAAEFDREIAPGWGDKPVYRQDPVLGAGVKAQLAGRQIGTQGMLDSLLSEVDDIGQPLMTTDETVAKTLKYVPLSSTDTAGSGTTYYAPKAIADDVSRFQAVITNDESIAKAQSMLEGVQKIWKAHATVPLIGAAFHMRNAQTNVVLNWSAGLTNPAWYSRAAKLQNKAWAAAKELGKDADAVTIDDILNASGKLSKQERRVLEQARKHNIFGSSFNSTDLVTSAGRSLEQRAVPQSKVRRTVGKLNPFDLNNFFGIKSGHAVAGAIENNARLAHFMWAMDKFGDVEQAALSTKKYLFNYDDLTDFEKNVMKKWIPFYTFMRKNTALVAQTLVENPGKANRYLMAERMSQDNDAAWLEGKTIPGYQMLGGQASRKAGPANVIFGMESPFSAAANTVAPFVQAAGEAPGLNRAIPEAMKHPEGKAGALRELLNIPGGPVPEAVGVAAEHAFDVNTFTGGDKRRQDTPDKVLEALGIIAPSPSKVNRITDQATLGKYDDLSDEEKKSRRTALAMNFALGLNASGVGEVSSEMAEENLWRSYIEKWIEQQNEGLDPTDPEYLPTLEIIQEVMGKNLPPGGLPKGRGRRGKSLMDLIGG